ncbi:Ca2+:H+ antiporter [Pseudonocardia thermophila]|uniref:Ca2+:H+ antiporter n=2 Tax=Pseudonocardia thermophila TaxID=1848 RepID=A0A1M6Z659_PSETH|nr:Ca2+:H+ antiporter [Pseudonocardia thermophila]
MHAPLTLRTVATPIAALVALVIAFGMELPGWAVAVVAIVLVAAVLIAVHHAEVVAHRVGEPFGSLILAVAVTVIEVGLILSISASGGEEAASLARDTVFAAVMITCNGIVGLCLLIGGIRHHVVSFQAEGSSGALAAVVTLATLCLVLPTFTTTSEGPTFSASQLVFAAIVSLVLFGVYVFVQTVRHRDYFLPVDDDPDSADDLDHDGHVDPPSNRTALISLGLLVASLVAVVGLAKTISPTIEEGVRAIGAPLTVVGVAIALLVLLPETLAAARAAGRDRLQTSFNLAYGSALASIGLTIPAIAVTSLLFENPLLLGLSGTEVVLLALTALIGSLTVLQGTAIVLQGAIHLLLFASFLFIALQP